MINKLSTTSPIRSGGYIRTRTHFFEASKLLAGQITEIFDQVWPAITALKNLRWQVRGYCDEYNIQSNSQLSEKFVEKEDKINRQNLYRTCIEQDWEEQEFYVAKNLLINLFACYEAWYEDLLSLVGKTNEMKKLQFPEILNHSWRIFKEIIKVYYQMHFTKYIKIRQSYTIMGKLRTI